MKKKIFTLGLSAIMALNTITMPPASATEQSGASAPSAADKLLGSSSWFYGQLSAQGQKIYNALDSMYNNNIMLDGRGSYDLVANNVIDNETAKKYIDGDRTLFNDFAAAKDAWDLEHPEAWYVDSSYLSLRTTQDGNNNYHVYIGPGRSDNYYVRGVNNSDDVIQKTNELNSIVNEIVSNATGTDAEKIKYVHNRIINTISYRFETECTKGNAGYVRTTYALATHEGVCEAYSRSMQLILQKLGIDCVPVHGIQTSGEPEAHMWNAVKLNGNWYVVDATWDDPVGVDKNGNIIYTNANGVDGGETETYLLVGKDIIGSNWHESGIVSSGNKEFKYPEISEISYGAKSFEKNGLKVVYEDDLMEESDSTVYRISFNGDGLTESAKKGYYFLVKMYDINADGSVDCFEDWYYPAHMLHTLTEIGEFEPDDDFRDNGNKYYTDTDNYMIMSVANCEYVEFAVTTKAPPNWQTAQDLIDMDGYYSGDYTDILAETGLMFNPRGTYEQVPYVKNASPSFNSSISAAQSHHIHIEFSDMLYHPDQDSIDNAVEGKVNDAEKAMNEEVAFDYRGKTYAWGMNGRKPHEFNKKPAPENVVLFCDTHEQHTDLSEIGADCKISAIEYDFTSSDMWGDDSVQHEFFFTGLVGVKSNKYPNTWSYVFENKYPFYTCPIATGFQWSMWGQPMLLDNPDNLDLGAMTVTGIDGKEQSLAELTNNMNLDVNGMNGKLMLVVEDGNSNREKTEELENAMAGGSELREIHSDVPNEAVLAKSLYEIDFARICRCTIVEPGQSVRLCVGFPAGFDSTMVGITFKAYHFTRNGINGEITSVEEIPCEVTPLGLVITCRKFSPFAIVALDNDSLDEAEINTAKSVIVSSEDGGAVVLEDGTVASGINGIISLKEGESVTLNITPNENMRLLSVSINGHNVKSDGTVTISYSDIENSSVMLSASFISDAVVRSDEAKGETVIAPEYVPATDLPNDNQGGQDNNGNIVDGESDKSEDKPENDPGDPTVTKPESNQSTSADNTEDGDADNEVKTPNTGVYSIAVPIMLLGVAAMVATIRKKKS